MQKKRTYASRDRAISGFPSKVISGSQGQITLFIILGMVLLLALVLLITLRKEITTTKPEEITPLARGPIEQMIASCISDLGEEAVFRLGQQGGYIEVPADIAGDASAHLRISPFLVVPYWASGPDDLSPSLEDLQQRIDLYVESKLRECVLGLEPFQKEYTIIEKSSIDSHTEIVSSRIIFNVRWNIEAKNKLGETITEVVDHVADSRIRLKAVHDTAREIIKKELREMKLEDITQDLIALEHPELPVAGLALSCDRKTWDVGKAKERLQDMLRINLHQLQLNGTEVVSVPPERSYYKYHYAWDFGDAFIQPDVSVTFNYQNNYPFGFQVTPAEGHLMRSGMLGGTDILSNLCLQIWKFTYDVNYPVLVRVKDETTGYTFQMAFMVHLVRNVPNRAEGLISGRRSEDLSFNVDKEYCLNAKIPMSVQAWENVENEAGVTDQQPLDGVKVQFACLKAGCEMGQTNFDFARYGFASVLTTNFPYCVGAIVRGTKEGYKEDWQRVVTKSGETIELNLAPLQRFPVAGLKVMTHRFAGVDKPLGQAQGLRNDEFAIIHLTHVKQGKQFHRVEQVVGQPIDVAEARKLNQEPSIDLLAKADFPYIVDVQVFRGDDFIGGYQANWTLPWHDLETAKEFTFHTVISEGSEDDRFFLLQGLAQASGLVLVPELT